MIANSTKIPLSSPASDPPCAASPPRSKAEIASQGGHRDERRAVEPTPGDAQLHPFLAHQKRQHHRGMVLGVPKLDVIGIDRRAIASGTEKQMRCRSATANLGEFCQHRVGFVVRRKGVDRNAGLFESAATRPRPLLPSPAQWPDPSTLARAARSGGSGASRISKENRDVIGWAGSGKEANHRRPVPPMSALRHPKPLATGSLTNTRHSTHRPGLVRLTKVFPRSARSPMQRTPARPRASACERR